MKKFKVKTHQLVMFEHGTIIEFNGIGHYKIKGDETSRKIPKEVVENVPLWFKEILNEN